MQCLSYNFKLVCQSCDGRSYEAISGSFNINEFIYIIVKQLAIETNYFPCPS